MADLTEYGLEVEDPLTEPGEDALAEMDGDEGSETKRVTCVDCERESSTASPVTRREPYEEMLCVHCWYDREGLEYPGLR